MRLSAKPIKSFGNINYFSYGNQWYVRAGDPNTLYFQLIDIDQAVSGNGQGMGVFSGISPVGTSAGQRYLVGVGTDNQPFSVSVIFMSIDDSGSITIPAVQADPNDSSIWKITIPSSQIPGGGNVQFAITEGSSIRRFSVLNMLAVEFPENDGSC